MAKITKINHVAVVVSDIDAALSFWRDALGIELTIEDVPAEVHGGLFTGGRGRDRIGEATSDDSGVAKFLQERGGGMHHLCLEVDDISAKLAELKAKGVRLINEEPRYCPGARWPSFIPKAREVCWWSCTK